MSNNPDLSVVIPCHNQGRFLSTAIDSALEQSDCFVQVIVVNDGSTDDTSQVAAKYAGRIDYVEQPNAGLSAARNRGIAEVRGEAVLFLDSDDYLAPDAATSHVKTLRSGNEISFGSWKDVDPEDRILRHWNAPDLRGDPFHALLRYNPFACHAIAVRTETIRGAGGFDTALKCCEDWDLWLRIAAQGASFAATPEAIAYYRRYPGSMSTNYRRMWKTGAEVIGRHSRSHHVRCAQCAAARKAGIKHWRNFCFSQLLLPRIRAIREKEGRFGAVRALTQAIIGDPLMISSVASRCFPSRFRR